MTRRRTDITRTNVKKLSIEDAAYIAGFIDADGTITLTKAKKRKGGGIGTPKPMILVVNTHWPIIDFLKSKIGKGCSYLTKATKLRPDQDRANWNPVHRYQITGKAAIDLCEQVRPYLRIKHQHAEIMCQVAIKGRDFPQFATSEQVSRGIVLERAIRELNARKRKDQPSLLVGAE